MKNIYKIQDELYIIDNNEKVTQNEIWAKCSFTGDILKKRNGQYAYKVILTTNNLLIQDGVQAIDDEFLEWFIQNPSCEEVEVEEKLRRNDYQKIFEIIIPKNEPKQLNSEDFGLPKIRTKEFNDLASASFGGKPNKNWFHTGEIIEPKEEPKLTPEFQEVIDFNDKIYKQETLEEAFEKWTEQFPKGIGYDKFDVLRFGAKWQQTQDKNKYSEEEVLPIVEYIQWIIRKIDKGNTPEEIVRLLLFERDKIEQFKKK